MKAYLRSAPIAPKKANIIAKMVRGMPVADAQEALRRTNKKAARMIEKLLKSAVANASHNDKQDTSLLVVKTLYVNQSLHYRRGIPKARGQMRPIKKFLSHITLTLGIADTEDKEAKKAEVRKQKAEKKAAPKPVADKKPAKAKAEKTDTPDTSSSSSH